MDGRRRRDEEIFEFAADSDLVAGGGVGRRICVAAAVEEHAEGPSASEVDDGAGGGAAGGAAGDGALGG